MRKCNLFKYLRSQNRFCFCFVPQNINFWNFFARLHIHVLFSPSLYFCKMIQRTQSQRRKSQRRKQRKTESFKLIHISDLKVYHVITIKKDQDCFSNRKNKFTNLYTSSTPFIHRPTSAGDVRGEVL